MLIRNNFLVLILCFVLSACSDNKDNSDSSTPAKEQIENYTKQVEECREDTASKKEEDPSSFMNKPVRGMDIFEDDIVIGDVESNVVVIEYFSPTCPHCYGFHKRTFPKIKEKYIDSNKVAYVIREFIGNKQDLHATKLARCPGDVDSYMKFMEVILSQQDSWAFNKKFEEILTNMGLLGGVSVEEYAACMQNEAMTQTLMENTRLPLKFPGFVGTPAFFINGKHFAKPYTFEELSTAIDKALNEQKPQ